MENSIVRDVEKIIKENIRLVEIDGEKYSNQDLKIIRHTDKASSIIFNDLSSIVAMIKNEANRFKLPLYINIESETSVSVLTSMDDHKGRENPYIAKYDNKTFRFGSYYSYEDFVIALRSQFVQNEDTQNLLEALKKITNSNNVEVADDGITQKVTMQQGAALASTAKVAPIRKLLPYRIFNEVAQPASEFLFRIRRGGGDYGGDYALYEADGGAWKIEAKNNIKTYFAENLAEEIEKGIVVIVG